MATKHFKLRYIRIGCSLGLVLGLVACSAKAPTPASLRGQLKGDENVEVDKTPTLGDEENSEGSGAGPSGDMASNDPKTNPGDTSMIPDDETVTPPIAQTGSGGDEKKNDPNQIVLNGYYFIKTAGAQKCLAVPGDSRDNGVQLEQKTCDIKSNLMKFEIEYLPSEKAYIISNRANQKFLEIRNQNEVIQAAIQQGDYFGMSYQMFLFEAQANNRFQIKSKTKGLFLDVSGASTADGALIQLWGDGNGISSSWILEPTL